MRSSISRSGVVAASTRVARGAAIVGAVVGLAIPLAGTAHATGARDGTCDDDEFCLYWDPVGASGGSLSDFAIGDIPNLGPTQPTCYEFRGDGVGKGECVWHLADSVWNRTNRNVRVFTNINYKNTSDLFLANRPRTNLNLAFRLNESIDFL
jgi:hypothetical protein